MHFVFCRLDYCNSLLAGISDSLLLLRRLQAVKNAALEWRELIGRTNAFTYLLTYLLRIILTEEGIFKKSLLYIIILLCTHSGHL